MLAWALGVATADGVVAASTAVIRTSGSCCPAMAMTATNAPEAPSPISAGESRRRPEDRAGLSACSTRSAQVDVVGAATLWPDVVTGSVVAVGAMVGAGGMTGGSKPGTPPVATWSVQALPSQ